MICITVRLHIALTIYRLFRSQRTEISTCIEVTCRYNEKVRDVVAAVDVVACFSPTSTENIIDTSEQLAAPKDRSKSK